jgi:hypothetical protein
MKIARILMLFAMCTLLVAGLSCSSSGSTTYQLTTVIEGQGSVSPSSGTYASESAVTLTALPESGWEFDHWGNQASGTQNPITITMNGDKAIYAYFVEEVTTPTPTPAHTSTKTPTPTSSGSSESSKVAAYNSVKDDLQNAVTGYATDHQGNFPYLTGTYSISGCTNCNIVNLNALLTSQGGMLRQVPDGIYSATGANNDNCDGGANGCLSNNHYVWLITTTGIVYSKCMGSDCNSNDASGYQGVWP